MRKLNAILGLFIRSGFGILIPKEVELMIARNPYGPHDAQGFTDLVTARRFYDNTGNKKRDASTEAYLDVCQDGKYISRKIVIVSVVLVAVALVISIVYALNGTLV